ncbi:MAG: hypothetical protein WAL63_00245 [Solirubrobacteraceae bacterium]
MSTPYNYEFANDEMSISYWTVVHGPIPPDGPSGLTYTDANGSVAVPMDQVHRHSVHGLGTVVTATISPPLAAVTTVLAFCIPPIDLTDDGPVPVTVAVIRALTADPVRVNAPETTYEVGSLTGTAGRPPIPFVAASVGHTGGNE